MTDDHTQLEMGPVTGGHDSDNEASSDKETFHESCWKRDRRLHPVSHIPRLPDERAEILHERLTEKKELKELMWPGSADEDATCCTKFLNFCRSIFPIMTWFPELMKDEERNTKIYFDVMAGLTVGVMAIPQSMSYADIAGLQYVYGMYAIFITCFIYGLTGESRQLGVGPVAMVSLIVEAGLAGLMTEEECPAYYNDNAAGEAQSYLCHDVYLEYVMTTSLLVGIINIAGGVMNLGFLVNFLAHPVVSGFTSGAAIIIGLSQVKYIFGFTIEKSQYVYVSIGAIIEGIDQIKPVVCVLGCLWILGLGFLSHASKNWPKWKFLRPFGPLIFCTAGIVMMLIFPDLKDESVEVIGSIPEGFPPISFNKWKPEKVSDVMSTAISASLIGYMESIAIGKALAAKHQYKIDAGGEMLALGITNFVGSAFSCYPVTGSFSRSAVNDATGAVTQFAGLFTSFIMFMTLLFLTPLFTELPKFCLAAIVINSVKNLVAYDEAIHLWRVKRSDCMLWICAFIGTLFLGIQLGIGLAVVLSLVVVVHETVRPQLVVLWRLPHTHVYSSIKTTTHGSFVPGVLVLRFMGSIYFANSQYLSDRVDQILAVINDEKKEKPDDIKFVVISLSACTSVDTSAIHALEDVHKGLAKKGVKLVFAQVGNRVWKTFHRSGFVHEIGEEWFHDSCHDAVQHCLAYDSSHIEDHHHFDNIEKAMAPLTKQDSELGIAAFGVHI